MRYLGGTASDTYPSQPTAEELCGASPNDKDVSLMLRAHRLPAILICLLIAGVVLLSATA
jgi:hypothetical protein